MAEVIKRQCQAVLARGDKKGSICGSNIKGEASFCSRHSKSSNGPVVENSHRISNIPKKTPLQPIKEEKAITTPFNSPSIDPIAGSKPKAKRGRKPKIPDTLVEIKINN